MTSIKMSIRKLKVLGNGSSVLVSYVFADFHLLHFGELKMRFLHIAPFLYRMYYETFSMFGGDYSSCDLKYKARIFAW